MKIDKIYLLNFRNFKKKLFQFSLQTTVIVGPNASGKTNILEAINLISTGKSFKAKVEEEMINYDAELARVSAKSLNLEVVLTRGEIEAGNSIFERVPRKKLLVNGISRRLLDFVGNLKTVLFVPSDLDIVVESPSVRRRFLDGVLSQVDKEYRRAVLVYEKGVRQRNRLLARIRDEGVSRSQLLFWNQLLIKNGDYLSQKREDFIKFLNDRAGLNDQKFSVLYDKSAISEVRLEQYKEEEVAAATTLVGPHRDDFVVNLEKGARKRNLLIYGSRGEQRMSVLWLKMAELAYLELASLGQSFGGVKEKPLLLLDDIFSELDHKHKNIVLEISKNQQTIVTTADEHNIEKIKEAEVIRLGV